MAFRRAQGSSAARQDSRLPLAMSSPASPSASKPSRRCVRRRPRRASRPAQDAHRRGTLPAAHVDALEPDAEPRRGGQPNYAAVHAVAQDGVRELAAALCPRRPTPAGRCRARGPRAGRRRRPARASCVAAGSPSTMTSVEYSTSGSDSKPPRAAGQAHHQKVKRIRSARVRRLFFFVSAAPARALIPS